MLKRLTTSSNYFSKQHYITSCMFIIYCAVQTESLSAGHVNFRLSESGDQSLASQRGEYVRSQVSPREIFRGQSSCGSGFSPCTSVVSCDYYSTNAPYSPSSTHCSYQQEKGIKSENLPKKQSSFASRGEWMENSFILFYFFPRFQRAAFWHSFTMNHVL